MIAPISSSAPTGRSQSLIFAQFGAGKTTMALTASAQCPAHIGPVVAPPPSGTPVTTVKDMAWLAYDRNALAGFASLKVEVPTLFDLSKVPANRIVEETLEILAWVRSQPHIEHVVLDTYTALDNMLQIRHRAKQDVKMKFYDAILADHMRIYDALRITDAEIQLLCHIKPAFDADDAAKARRMALDIADYTAKISGQAGDRLKADCDNIVFLQRKSAVKDGKKVVSVVARTQPMGGVECKVRGGVHLPEEMPADWRVIRAALEGR